VGDFEHQPGFGNVAKDCALRAAHCFDRRWKRYPGSRGDAPAGDASTGRFLLLRI
jgi:hypothetical protein